MRLPIGALAMRSTSGDYDGEIAAAAFEALDDGVDAADLVKRLKIRPEIAESLMRAWCDMRGALFIPGNQVAKIERCWWTSGNPIRNGDVTNRPQAMIRSWRSSR